MTTREVPLGDSPRVHIPRHPTPDGWYSWRCPCGIGAHGFDTRGMAMQDAAKHCKEHHDA